MQSFFVALVLVLAATTSPAQTPARLDLVGHVIMPPGKSTPATVVALFANLKPCLPEPGASYPSYPILPKRTQTDSQGNFKIESLDPAWLYYVLVIAPGCKLQTFDRVDVAAGPLNANLETKNPTNATPGTALHGRVLDTHGKPVPGALISMQEVTRNHVWYFSADRIDAFSTSDDAGNFVVYGQTPFTDGGGAIEAPGFATGLFEHWTSGTTNHELILTEGAAFRGRLLQAGKPVSNVEICLDNFGAEAGSTAWTCSTLTDDQGRFSFMHLPPNHSFNLNGTMASLAGRGAVPEQVGQVHADGSTNDIGDLNLEPAYTVEGRIRLADGKPIPAGSRLFLQRNRSGRMDSMGFALGKDGAFHFAGVPAESVQLRLRIPDYELTPMDSRLISGSATNFTMVTNLTGLDIEMKPRSR